MLCKIQPQIRQHTRGLEDVAASIGGLGMLVQGGQSANRGLACRTLEVPHPVSKGHGVLGTAVELVGDSPDLRHAHLDLAFTTPHMVKHT